VFSITTPSSVPGHHFFYLVFGQLRACVSPRRLCSTPSGILGPPKNWGTLTANPGEITLLLQQWRTGDRGAEARLFELLMPDLRRIAGRCFRGERPGHTLQPTALVHEAFLRLAAAKNIDWRDRGHFFALSARVMRHHLIDHARARPGVKFLPMEGLPPHVLQGHSRLELAIAVNLLLDELESESHQRCAVVELKFFLGLTDEEAADSLNLSLHTLQREWYRARRWLFERLSTEPWKVTPNTTNG
jgi:RNA polymerase sigma-70 factor (ECF subfamily)